MTIESVGDLTLFAAFRAGFGMSGEGHNGEYVRPEFDDLAALEAELRRSFDRWLRNIRLLPS